jgi:uncharacterized protein
VTLHDEIRKKNLVNNKSRVVAGYCWNWISKNNPEEFDINLNEFGYKAKWNLAKYKDSWIINSESIEEVGCIHTCQGLEVDYIGVIVGQDFLIRNGKIYTDPTARAKSDASLNGFIKESKVDKEAAYIKADELIRNTYKTLMSRGMKGCYVYFTDKETSDYFKNAMPRL